MAQQLRFSDVLVMIALFSGCVLAQDRVPINTCAGKLNLHLHFIYLNSMGASYCRPMKKNSLASFVQTRYPPLCHKY